MTFSQPEKALILDVVRASIRFGLARGSEISVSPEDYPEPVRERRATFVTLRYEGDLQGCVGTVRAIRPLICDVAHNAFHAAFHDQRFPALVAEQLEALEVHVSILSRLERMPVASERELLQQLRPGVDGLVLEEGDLRATFLPAMWSQLGSATEFVRLLKQKAGLPRDYWSPDLQALRYTTDDIP